MSEFSPEFENLLKSQIKDIKEEINSICINMSSEETTKKKQDLIASLENTKELLLQQHNAKSEEIKSLQRDAAKIHREGEAVEAQLQQLRSGPFAGPVEEPKKKVKMFWYFHRRLSCLFN